MPIKPALKSQYHASLAMLREAIEASASAAARRTGAVINRAEAARDAAEEQRGRKSDAARLTQTAMVRLTDSLRP